MPRPPTQVMKFISIIAAPPLVISGIDDLTIKIKSQIGNSRMNSFYLGQAILGTNFSRMQCEAALIIVGSSPLRNNSLGIYFCSIDDRSHD